MVGWLVGWMDRWMGRWFNSSPADRSSRKRKIQPQVPQLDFCASLFKLAWLISVLILSFLVYWFVCSVEVSGTVLPIKPPGGLFFFGAFEEVYLKGKLNFADF